MRCIKKKISISSATGIQRELNSFNIGCDAQTKSEYICINVLYPIISVIPTQLFVTLLVEEKNVKHAFLIRSPSKFLSVFHPLLIKSSPRQNESQQTYQTGIREEK